MRGASAVLFVALITIGFAAPSAHADEITITSGDATVAPGFGEERITMTLDFDDATLAMRWSQTFILPRVVCSPHCQAGDLLSLNTTAFHTGPINTERLENDAVGVLTVHGVASPLLAFTGSLSFVTPGIIVPQSTADFVTLTAPFTMSGTIQGFDANGRDPVLLFTDSLTGQGTATAKLTRNPPTNTFQQIAPIQYDFTPTPEPSSVLLVSCGAALVLAWQRYRFHIQHRRAVGPVNRVSSTLLDT